MFNFFLKNQELILNQEMLIILMFEYMLQNMLSTCVTWVMIISKVKFIYLKITHTHTQETKVLLLFFCLRQLMKIKFINLIYANLPLNGSIFADAYGYFTFNVSHTRMYVLLLRFSSERCGMKYSFFKTLFIIL